MTEIRFLSGAQGEYQAAFDWYEQRSLQAANRFEEAVAETLELIRSNPALFPKYEPGHQFAGLKRFPYKIIYQQIGQVVYVIAMAHYSRSPEYWKDRAE